LSIINHKKRKEENKEERDHQPEEVAVEVRSNLICPTRKFKVQSKGINTPSSTVHLIWMTLKRFGREKEIS
jgi:hypothetical protein